MTGTAVPDQLATPRSMSMNAAIEAIALRERFGPA
jgi:hypothetical protein